MQDTTWFEEVEEIIRGKRMMDHPFNVAWREGRLKLEDIRHYGRQYFHHVDFFPRYVSAVHSNTPDMPTRQMLVDNLREEDEGPENHPELFLRFCEGTGLNRDEVLDADLREETKKCVETFMDLAKNQNHLVGLSALFAYESQQPELSGAKVKRLDVHYGIIDRRAYKFFEVHQEADVWHSQVERDALKKGATTEEQRELVKKSVATACDAVLELFDGIAESCGLSAPAA